MDAENLATDIAFGMPDVDTGDWHLGPVTIEGEVIEQEGARYAPAPPIPQPSPSLAAVNEE